MRISYETQSRLARANRATNTPKTFTSTLEDELTRGLEGLLKLPESRLNNDTGMRVSALLNEIYASSIHGFTPGEISEKSFYRTLPIRKGGDELDVPSVRSFLRSMPSLMQVRTPIDQQVGILLDKIEKELNVVLNSDQPVSIQ